MIYLPYGNRQQFQLRHGDINILGQTNASLPAKRSQYRLNDAELIHFYIEPESLPGEGEYAWDCKTPSIFRLRDCPGAFNIEISIESLNLKKGWNRVGIEIEDSEGTVETLIVEINWNPQPLTLPIQLTDFTSYENIQEIGQVVNGHFEIDRQRNSIVSTKPVGADILLLLGSPNGSQEATYDIEFDLQDGNELDYAGLSDFFARHEEQSPGLGIKPGYCTSGLATLSPTGMAKLWMAVGDCLTDKDWAWVIHTEEAAHFPIQSRVRYQVRHQVIIHGGVNWSRYKIWKKDEEEPNDWLCQQDNAYLNRELPRIDKVSFGLFQFGGNPSAWSNIFVQRLELTPDLLAEIERKKRFHSIQRKRVELYFERFLRRVRNLTLKISKFMRHQQESLYLNKSNGNSKNFIKKM